MKNSGEKKSLLWIAPVLILLLGILVNLVIVFDLRVPWAKKSATPDVSVSCGEVYIFKDIDCKYTLVATYVFSNKGKRPVSFDSCYETAALVNGTACQKAPNEKAGIVTDTEDLIQPGATVVLQVGYVMKGYMPGQSADISVRLYEQFAEKKLIQQDDCKASDLIIKEQNPYCWNC